ncbi:MAG: DUF3365 domain-containing protein [Burkholderiales bacterium]|nr:DUF3365 domain-containing protein [Burkholderiales bacterium]
MRTKLVIAALAAMSVAAPAAAQDVAKMTEESRAVAGGFQQKLGGELKQAIAQGGADGAIGVCRNIAPQIAGDLSLKNGWHVSRVSLKTRNTMIGVPDAWEQKVLAEFDARAAKGDDPAKLEFAEVVTEPAGQYFRYMKALPVQTLCLSCHGGAADVPPAVKTKLGTEYPHDRATGYSAGQIRGAITIKRPL